MSWWKSGGEVVARSRGFCALTVVALVALAGCVVPERPGSRGYVEIVNNCPEPILALMLEKGNDPLNDKWLIEERIEPGGWDRRATPVSLPVEEGFNLWVDPVDAETFDEPVFLSLDEVEIRVSESGEKTFVVTVASSLCP